EQAYDCFQTRGGSDRSGSQAVCGRWLAGPDAFQRRPVDLFLSGLRPLTLIRRREVAGVDDAPVVRTLLTLRSETGQANAAWLAAPARFVVRPVRAMGRRASAEPYPVAGRDRGDGALERAGAVELTSQQLTAANPPV